MNTKYINLSRLNKSLLSVLLISLLLYLGRPFLIPIAIAAFFAMLLYPLVRKLMLLNIKETMAALISVLVLLTSLIIVSSLIYYQVSRLRTDLPRLEEKIEEKTNTLQGLLYKTTDLSQSEQEQIIEEKKPDIAKTIFKSVKDVLVNGLLILLYVFIVLTYTFFFLIYQQRIQVFFVRLHLFVSQRESMVMFARISRIIHDYLKGTFTVISIMAVVYALGLFAIGIEHALLFALLTAIMRIVPFFGSYLGIAFTVTFAFLITDTLWQPILVLAFFVITQLIEANLLTPYITGSKVKLNPLATIMAILLGKLLWGVPGMVFFVPLFASSKVIFDRIPKLNPLGYILGKDEKK